MADYPPEPWDLRGQLHATTFLVPASLVPLELPVGWRPVRVAGRLVVGTAWVSYEPPGVLAYREVMATVLARRGFRVAVHIVRIWVDSSISRDGGRALWAIPKELATFDFDGGSFAASDEKGAIARASVRRLLRLPGRLPVRFSVVQSRDGGDVVSPVSTRASILLARATSDADPSGPLAFLAGRRPLLAVSLGDFAMKFGGSRD